MPLFTYEDLYVEVNNLPKTRSLFCQYDKNGLLSVSRKDIPGKVNLYKLYIDFCVDDPSEVKFAEEVFGDIVWWVGSMSQDTWFKKHLDEWRMAAAEKRKSLAFKAIIKEVKEGGKSAFTASKYLIEEPWLTGASASEKKEIAKKRRATAENAFLDSAFKDDIARLKDEGIIQ